MTVEKDRGTLVKAKEEQIPLYLQLQLHSAMTWHMLTVSSGYYFNLRPIMQSQRTQV